MDPNNLPVDNTVNSIQPPVGGSSTSSDRLNTDKLKLLFSGNVTDAVIFVEHLTEEIVALGVSDLLIEPRKSNFLVRVRIDGYIYEVGEISKDLSTFVIARLKILSGLDPAEKRKVQEGQFNYTYENRPVNFRVEIAQTIHGELVVLRLHEKQTIVMNLSQLGFNNQAFDDYNRIISQKSGLVLVCGPTGCGKTTTLYSTISKLNENKEYNVMTVENPVEFQLEGVNQMQINEETGFTFADGLRTILRLSPDIVLVGEIRDKETAKIAVETGLTGQLVLSTIHAADAVGTMFRMLDLGVESYLINSSLLGVVAQRLVRKTCPHCLVTYEPTADELDTFETFMGRPPGELKMGSGCEKCNGLGFKGRLGIYEVLTMDAELRGIIRNNADEKQIREHLDSKGFITLIKDGLSKCEMGVTTIEDVMRNSLRFS